MTFFLVHLSCGNVKGSERGMRSQYFFNGFTFGTILNYVTSFMKRTSIMKLGFALFYPSLSNEVMRKQPQNDIPLIFLQPFGRFLWIAKKRTNVFHPMSIKVSSSKSDIKFLGRKKHGCSVSISCFRATRRDLIWQIL